MKNDADKPTLKTQLSNVQNYQPSKSTLIKHRILKKLRNDKETVILRPGKGSGVVVLNRTYYEKSNKNLINEKTKFKELSEDVTIKREPKLQRFLRTLKNNKCLDDVEYERIYPSSSSPAKIYGSPKMLKPFDSNSPLNFRSIVFPLALTITIFPNIFVNSFLLIYRMNFAQKTRSHLWRS